VVDGAAGIKGAERLFFDRQERTVAHGVADESTSSPLSKSKNAALSMVLNVSRLEISRVST